MFCCSWASLYNVLRPFSVFRCDKSVKKTLKTAKNQQIWAYIFKWKQIPLFFQKTGQKSGVGLRTSQPPSRVVLIFSSDAPLVGGFPLF